MPFARRSSGCEAGAGRVSIVRSGIERAADLAAQPSVRGVVGALRQLFRVEVAYATRHSGTHQVLEAVEGYGPSFGIADGEAIPLEDSYCQRILDGELPAIVRDVRAHPVARGMAITSAADVGAFASVPLTLSDGSLYGTLCCESHERQPGWQESDVRVMYVMGRLAADQVEHDVLERNRGRIDMQALALTALLGAVDARDGYTGEHSRAVVAHARVTARTLNLPAATVTDVEHVAILHDVGKLGVPSAILSKPGPLDADEWEIMRQHPVTGERIVAGMPTLAHLATAIRAEHERWDGGGYPDGLAGPQIPIASRIVLACDAYHAMTSSRPYRRGMPSAAARAELLNGSGTQFEPAVVAALCVALEHDRTTNVSDQPPARLAGPVAAAPCPVAVGAGLEA
jgi:HD-GYP domain-containing protein (c-di-GMP phosphodiesterase class II)